MKSENKNLGFVLHLQISSEKLTGDQISEILQLQATKTSSSNLECKGSCSPYNFFYYTVSKMAKIESTFTSREVAHKALTEMLDKIEPLALRFERLRGQARIGLMGAFASPNNSEWFSLPEDILARLSTLQIPIQILLLPSCDPQKDQTTNNILPFPEQENENS